MTFPTTSILDEFTGADEDPIATNWSGPVRPSGGQLVRLSNQLARGGAGPANWLSYWDQAIFGPDTEAYITLAVLPTSGQSISIVARVRQGPGTGDVDFYQGSYTVGTGWRMFRVTNNAYTQIGSTVATPAMIEGDGIGLEVTGDDTVATVRVLHRTLGAWTEVTSFADNQAARNISPGFIGVELTDTTTRADSFGGGTVITVPSTLVSRRSIGLGRWS